MTYRQPGRAAVRRARSILLAALVVSAALLIGGFASQRFAARGGVDPPGQDAPTVAVHQRPVGATTLPPATTVTSDQPPAARAQPKPPARPATPPARGQSRAPRTGRPVFDETDPGVAKLDPVLLRALREAANDAARDRVVFQVTSGWRSPEHQAQLLRDAIAKYGSAENAARWVATPETSAHVSGDAVDIGPSAASAWLAKHGSKYGLCQIYRNEPWHFELRPRAADHGCPPMYADPTHDPRMRR